MADNLLPRSIGNIPHIANLDLTADHRLNNIDLDKALVLLIDTVASSALPYLAQQFDIITDRAYQLATTDLQRRAIIKDAINKKRARGTVASVEDAMTQLGYTAPNFTLAYGIGSGIGAWAVFGVQVAPGVAQNAALDAELTLLIMQRKNVRSRFLGVMYPYDIIEVLPPATETISLNAAFNPTNPSGAVAPNPLDALSMDGSYLDGSWNLDGSRRLIDGVEACEYTIV